MAKRKLKKNFILAVIKRDGTYSHSQKKVAQEFTHFYCDFLGNGSFGQQFDAEILSRGPLLPKNEAMTLVKDISRQEIKDALFSIGDDKSLGPDGYSSCFFKKGLEYCWH